MATKSGATRTRVAPPDQTKRMFSFPSAFTVLFGVTTGV
jgi:hypothetical protein